MTYDLREISQQDGAPIELYEFTSGTQTWRYTSAEIDVTVDGELYASASITRTSVAVSQEKARNAITLTVPRNHAVADLFRIAAPTEVVALVIRRYHRGETEDVAVIWLGRVLNTVWEGAQATLSCEPASTSLQRTGLRRRYSRQCQHVLYGPACRLNKADFAHETTVVEQDGLLLQVASFHATLTAAGGFVEWDNGTQLERRYVRAQSGGLLLVQPFQGIEPDDPVTIYPGCGHAMSDCQARGNLPNYGGFPFVPRKNPFGNEAVF